MTKPINRALSAILALTMVLGLLPAISLPARAIRGSGSVFDELGFETIAPDGYEQDEDISKSPYGKTYTTTAEVSELLIMEVSSAAADGGKSTLYGDGITTPSSLSAFWGSATSKTIDKDRYIVAMEGNFSTDNNGQKRNIALVTLGPGQSGGGVSPYANGQLFIGVADAKNPDARGALSSSADCISIGNTEDRVASSTAQNSFMTSMHAYRYLKLAVGDFDGDGIDEVAAYIPQRGNLRVEIYKLQKTDGTSYLSSGNWALAWTHNVGGYGATANNNPNMISLVAGDFNKDGIDDLAFSHGHYSTGSSAVIMLGAGGGSMLTDVRTFSLKSGGSDILRASFATGDVDGDGYNELVLGGSLSGSGVNARYVAIYEWNGSDFIVSTAEEFDLFEQKDGAYTHQNMKDEGNKYYSTVYTPANIAVGNFYGLGTAPCIYIDSIIVEYGSTGFKVLDLLDKRVAGGGSTYFTEWGVRAADLTGNGTHTLIRNIGMLTKASGDSKPYNDHTAHSALMVASDITFQAYSLVDASSVASAQGVYSHTVEKWWGSTTYDYAQVAFCLPNTDNDTVILKYTGEHYYTYADPEVLAVLASPPFFSDLANEDDESSMIESATSYSSSSGSGSGSSKSNSFSVGVYTSWEKTVSILGVEIASFEAEMSINNSFTWETEQTSSLEYEVTYSTMAGQDTVVLYSMPIESYVYQAMVPDGKGGYDTQTMLVNIPYEPSVQTISLEKYQDIQKDYTDILPEIGDNVFSHTVGVPGSYPSTQSQLPASRTQTLVYNGDPSTIGQGSQSSIEQKISMTQETSNSFNYQLDIETKAGGGAGGVKVGVMAGYGHGAGTVSISTAGSSYTGTLNGLPSQAEAYGYSFNWKLVGFLHQNKYPVVTYLVSSVVSPPLLPTNLRTNDELTTSGQLALEWDYSGNAAGFALYRYFQSSGAPGYYEIATIGEDNVVSTTNGVRTYRYIDKALEADKSYKYRIQTIGVAQPNLSIPSEEYQTYTKPTSGMPIITVTSQTVAAYPDITASTEAIISNKAQLTLVGEPSYQWQKRQSNGKWANITGRTAAELSFSGSNPDIAGVYRCQVGVLSGSNMIIAYSPEVTVTYDRRSAQFQPLQVSGNTITATLKGVGVSTVPGGNVTVTLESADGGKSYIAPLSAAGVATVEVSMAKGIYKVTADYYGDTVFKPAKADSQTPVFYNNSQAANSTYIDVKAQYTYGDSLDIMEYTIAADGSVTGAPVSLDEAAFAYKTGNSYVEINAIYDNFQSFGEEGNPSYVDRFVLERFKGGRAAWAGEIRLTLGGEDYDFKVLPKDVTVAGLEARYVASISQMDTEDEAVATLEGILKGLPLEGVVEWDSPGLLYEASKIVYEYGGGTTYKPSLSFELRDTAGTLRASMKTKDYTTLAPGNYRLQMTKNAPSAYTHVITDNYNFVLPETVMNIIGATYAVSAAPGNDLHGTVAVTSPANATAATVGQTLIFRATPFDGYEVDYWAVNGAPVSGSQGMTTLTHVQTSAGSQVTVYFKIKANTLTVGVLPAAPTVGGTPVENKAVTADPYFTSGNIYAAGYQITFAPQAAAGWHFTGWEYHVAGQAARYSTDSSFAITMPDASVTLYAKYERDTYGLTLGPNLEAYANGQKLTSLTGIVGDTQITVQPAPGYTVAANGTWQVNGTAAGTDGSCTFALLANTSVTAKVQAGGYTVTLADSVTGGTASATHTGTVAGGTQVTFTATPARGYQFSGWAVGGSTIADNPYTATVAGDMSVTPTFSPQTPKKVTITTSAKGTLGWAIAGVSQDAYTNEISLYQGESVTFTAAAKGGFMISGWRIGGTYTAGGGATKTFTYDDLPATVECVFASITSFQVSFASNITATVDGEGITSGDLVGSGNTVVFTYTGADQITGWKNGGTTVGTASATYTIESLSAAQSITAVTAALTYPVTVSSAGTGASGGGSYASGATVTINAGTAPDGQRFKRWSASPAVTFANALSASTTFEMLGQAVTVTAEFEALEATVTSVTITPATKTMNPSTTFQFTATVEGTNNPSQSVLWSVEGGGANTSINSDTGYLTVGYDETPDTILTVTASSKVDAEHSATATVTVVGTGLDTPTVTGVTITPTSVTVSKGGSYTFSAAVSGQNGPSQAVTWSVTDSQGSAVASSISGGVLTVASTETAATLTVTATSVADPAKSASATVTVPQPVAVTPPTITTLYLAGGTAGTAYSQTLAATGGTPISWAITAGSLPTGLSLSGATISGTPTTAGTYTVTVTATNSGGTDSRQLTIVIAAQPPATYALTISAGSGGSISVGASGNYAAGAAVTIAAAPSSGYTFSGWSSTNGGTFANAASSATTFTMPAAATTITASFTATGGEHVHSYSPATCTASQACACGATQGAALGHSWGAWSVTIPATATTAGTERRACTRTGCTTTETRAIPPTGDDSGGGTGGTGGTGGGGGGGGGGTATKPPVAEIPVAPGDGTGASGGNVAVPVIIEGGKVEMVMDDEKIAQIIGQATAGQDTGITVDLSAVDGAESAQLPQAAALALLSEEISVTVKLPQAEITLSPAALATLTGVGGQDISVEVRAVPQAQLSAAQAMAVSGLDTVINVDIFAGATKVNVPVTISMPYTLKANQNANGVRLWHLDDDGTLTPIDAVYNPATGMLTAVLPHQSYFVIGYSAHICGDFTDITGHWGFESICWCIENGIMNGTGGGLFAPNSGMTRAMFAQVLYNMEGSPEVSLQDPFTDVGSQWFTDAVLWAYQNGIARGVGGGRFDPNRQITRQEMAVMLYAYAGFKGYELPQNRLYQDFADHSRIDVWAETEVRKLFEAGVLNGKPENLFDPTGTATRAEAATMLRQFAQNIVKE